ncbi:MAG TPA: DNA polymerase III subunit alpha [Ktedonobacterales bacterium]|jgi:error-prone DNA polymerase
METYSTTGYGHLSWCELHCHTPFSFRAAGSSIEALVARAKVLGMSALAITDTMTLAGVVRFHRACQAAGIRPITGCELVVRHPDGTLGTLIALAKNREGYAHLCQLLTMSNLAADRSDPHATSNVAIALADLAARRTGLTLLIGGCDGRAQRLAADGQMLVARTLLEHYIEVLGQQDLYIEIQRPLLPESGLLLARMVHLAREVGLPCVASNGVRYAVAEDCQMYDLMTCIRLGIGLDAPHHERPRNTQQYLKAANELAPLFANVAPAAMNQAIRVAASCSVEMLASACTPPQMPLPAGETPATYLRKLCDEALPGYFPEEKQQKQASAQLAKELAVIGALALEEFFLVIWDIMREARRRGIRCAGRGSAANSLVAYLLGITAVDPLAHHLLFERFLNVERQTMPDIDVDVQSSRREELIGYVEATYSEQHAAMVANVVTYRLRLAVRDTAKALGFPLSLISQLTKRLPPFGRCSDIGRYEDVLWQALGKARGGHQWEHRLRVLLAIVPRLEGFPRHLSLHNGGLLLTRASLTDGMVVRRSANGVRAVELDKDDVEALGYIKFDLLGLRTFDAMERCLALIEQTDGERPPVDDLSLDPPDAATMDLVRRGQTLAVFQIESPAQWNLLARTQPQTFDDLVIQTALCRPGPIQAGMIHPYIARHAGRAPVRYAYPALEPILKDTLGIVLYQEQVLEIAHIVAGLSYGDADGFRKAMSHYRTSSEMEGMRARFITGAVGQGIPHATATRIFDEIACFVGYGFCRSHAAAFARTIYQTAWLKAHYPAHYLAAFLASQPAGFCPAATVLEEAKLLGIPVLPVDIQASPVAFTVEQIDGEYAIRIGLLQVKGVGEALAEAIVVERDENGPYRSLASICTRVGARTLLRREGVAALVAAGACDGFGIPRRRLAWLLEERWASWSIGLLAPTPRRRRTEAPKAQAQQAALPWVWADEQPAEAPKLPPLTLEQETQLDLATQGLSARPHPLTFHRKALRNAGFLTLAQLKQVKTGRRACVAGLVISAQRPPTAKGMGFIVLEDETGRVQVALPPPLAETLRPAMAESRILAVAGGVERSAGHVTLFATRFQPYTQVGGKNTIRARRQDDASLRVRGAPFDQRLIANSVTAPVPAGQVARADFS